MGKEAMIRKTKYRGFLGFLILILIAAILLGGRFLVVKDELFPVEAIVVIGGDHKPQRMQQAFDLYKDGQASILIISAGTVVLEGAEFVPEAEVMRRQALSLGFSEDALVIEDKSQTTVENAQLTKILLKERGIQSIILVTSAYHSRRARRIFRDELGADIHISVQPSKPINHPLLWMIDAEEKQVVQYEYRNWLLYWLN